MDNYNEIQTPFLSAHWIENKIDLLYSVCWWEVVVSADGRNINKMFKIEIFLKLCMTNIEILYSLIINKMRNIRVGADELFIELYNEVVIFLFPLCEFYILGALFTKRNTVVLDGIT